MRECENPTCTTATYAHGLCKKHYMAIYRRQTDRVTTAGRSIDPNRAEFIWQSIAKELGITGSNGRAKAI